MGSAGQLETGIRAQVVEVVGVVIEDRASVVS
jgi:hypothetical protein